MADVTFKSVDQGLDVLNSWHLLKPLTVAQTAVTAAKLAQTLRDVSFAEAFFVISVARFGKIRIQQWGVASNNDVDVLDLYGWSEDGPGSHIGKLTVTYGNFQSAANTGFHTNAHKSITGEYAEGVAYRGADTFVETNDYDGALTIKATEADFPGHCMIDFTNSQYKYFGVAVTTLGGTSNGLIFKPLSLKETVPQPTP